MKILIFILFFIGFNSSIIAQKNNIELKHFFETYDTISLSICLLNIKENIKLENFKEGIVNLDTIFDIITDSSLIIFQEKVIKKFLNNYIYLNKDDFFHLERWCFLYKLFQTIPVTDNNFNYAEWFYSDRNLKPIINKKFPGQTVYSSLSSTQRNQLFFAVINLISKNKSSKFFEYISNLIIVLKNINGKMEGLEH